MSGDWRDTLLLERTIEYGSNSLVLHRLGLERMPAKHLLITLLPPSVLCVAALIASGVGSDRTEKFTACSSLLVGLMLLLIRLPGEIQVMSPAAHELVEQGRR